MVDFVSVSASLLLVLCLGAKAEIAIHVPGEQNRSLQYYLCEGGLRMVAPNVKLVLEATEIHYLTNGGFCVVENLTNVTLISSYSKGEVAAQVVCVDSFTHGAKFSNSGTGMGFVNCVNFTLSNVVIKNCGAALSSSVLDSGNDNSSLYPAYFGTNQAATLYFSHTRDLRLMWVAVESYYGFAIAVVNPQGKSQLHTIRVNASISCGLCPALNNTVRGNYTCYGSGILVYVHDSVEGSRIPPASDSCLMITNTSVEDNFYYNDDWVCVTNVFQFQPEKVPIIAGAGLTVYFTQTSAVVNVTLADSNISSNLGYFSGGVLAVYINSVLHSNLTMVNVQLSHNRIIKYPCEGGAMVGKMS